MVSTRKTSYLAKFHFQNVLEVAVQIFQKTTGTGYSGSRRINLKKPTNISMFCPLNKVVMVEFGQKIKR